MKKIFLPFLFSIAIMLSNSSCSDYLDVVPEGTPSMDNAFSNRINAFKYLHTCYSYLPPFDDAGQALGFLAGDEHWLIPKGTGFIDTRLNITAWEIGRGAQNSNNPYKNYWDGSNAATNLWIGIRDCNIFINSIHKTKDVNDYERDRWICEAKFLKAYYHFYLFQLYGPIPIMDAEMPVDGSIEEVRRYRYPVDEVVSYISNLLDESLEYLPLSIVNEGEEMGRITQPIAKAVKAQLLLLAASPLFNNGDYANEKDNRGVALFPSQYDENKWKLAADAALDAIQTAKDAGHKMHYFTDPIIISPVTRKLLDISESVAGRWNSEIIWGSTRNSDGLQTLSMAKSSTGAYYTARSLLSPTLTVAEQFYSSNGVPISEDTTSLFWGVKYPDRYEIATIADVWNNKYYMEINQQTANLHLYREPRFYASLSFDRSVRYSSGMANDAQATLSKIRMRRTEAAGLINSEDHSITGYLNKKVCSYRSNLTGSGWTPHRYAFPIIRLADLYLMYAEALNESLPSPDQRVWDAVDSVRLRAGIPGVLDAWSNYSRYPNKPLNKAGMSEIIRMERLNELACEGKRFWDLRRWKRELPNEILGWNIDGNTAETFYRVTKVFERPRFNSREFLWPLSIGSIQKNPNLKQNPGW
ncbi:MAG: RagB/SusD family nutrient uptake outer membrane protein [Prevotellaceae bacterium]|jgi:hypothetical protein|nr:RagB/SusD family nutrient uptake outer membrane protein [Prevotellaceae bacterium]